MSGNEYKHKLNKVMTEQEAVSTFLKDGDTFTVGGFLLNRESDCVFREIARQGRKHLTFIEESCSFGIDILIGIGALDRFDLAYMPQRQIGGINGLPCLERCFKEGDPKPVNMGGVMQTPNYEGSEKPLEVVDWTNFMVSLRFVAGALNVPFMPCRSSLGTDIPKYNKEIMITEDPFEKKPIAYIPALRPDVAFISVQKADRRGNGQVFGYKGVDEWKARAAKHVVLFTEELVTTKKIAENPALTVVPSHCTDAVVVLPYNSHPHGVFGRYTTDGLVLFNNTVAWQTRKGFEAWMNEWVYGCKDHFEYCEKTGWEKLDYIGKSESKSNPLPDD
ncbi:MAG: CoA transferase subunit A [Proteobacteria bacterium]|nr:CoA transferase subunit A [Pseudomonadota bacterium]